MKSKTKNSISNEQIIQLVKSNFGDNTEVGKIEELKGGMFNSAYLIERVKEQDNIILKVAAASDAPLLSYEMDLMPTEVEVYRLIAEQSSVPVPKILCHDLSKSLINSNYFFMTALKGEVMKDIKKKLTPENLDIIKKELGQYFAQIHKIKGIYFGYFTTDEAKQFTSWKEAFMHMVQMILKDGKNHNVNLPYHRIEKALINNSSYLEVIKEPSLVDYDLWAGNIFLIKKGNEYHIEGIVDFERAFWGDPLADFPTAIMILGDLQKETVFWNSYTDASGRKKVITKEDLIRVTMYKLYIHLIMTIETYRFDFLYGMLQKAYAKSIVMKCIKILEENSGK